MNDKIYNNMKKHNVNLAKYACSDSEAIRFKKIDKDVRTAFFRDIDKILYSLSYIRYIDKTQVFSNNSNDMISRRMTHVQMVSKIARTIGRALNLNEDLIEAASLGHDLGHVPFGHVGESILNKLSLEYGEGYFNHNVQSVRTLMRIEHYGKGNNITVQVLDAILCHNGEMLQGKYYPVSKKKEKFLEEYYASYKDKEVLKKIHPMTLEGCVVRISDIIAYIGKDIDDAIRLGKISSEIIPLKVSEVLGSSNSEIVNTIIMDIIKNSLDKNYIAMSKEVKDALDILIDFNYKNIYFKANTLEQIAEYEDKFRKLFALYFKQIEDDVNSEDIFTLFLNDMSVDYNKNETSARKVIDYMAGMTDDFFLSQYEKYFSN